MPIDGAQKLLDSKDFWPFPWLTSIFDVSRLWKRAHWSQVLFELVSKKIQEFWLEINVKGIWKPHLIYHNFFPLPQCQQQGKKYLVKLLRYKNFECNFKKCLALLHCRAMALKLALKPICMKPYLTFWAFSDFSRTQMDYVTSKSLVNQRCKIAEKYLAKLKYFFPKNLRKRC